MIWVASVVVTIDRRRYIFRLSFGFCCLYAPPSVMNAEPRITPKYGALQIRGTRRAGTLATYSLDLRTVSHLIGKPKKYKPSTRYA